MFSKVKNNIRYFLIFSSFFLMLFWLKKNKSKKKSIQSKNILELVSDSEIKTLDPIECNDIYSSRESGKVYERLFINDPFSENFHLIPCLAKNLPEISSDKLKYKIKLKKDVFFHDNKCFPQGKGRKIKVEDIIYSIMRNADPHFNSRGYCFIENKIKGLDEWRKNQKNQKKSNYDINIQGFNILDDYTLEINLKNPCPEFIYILSLIFFSIVPREGVEYYEKEFINNPVGTGPFKVENYNPNEYKIEYIKNKNYRSEKIPEQLPENLQELYKDCIGKKIPLVDKIITYIIKDPVLRWNKFIEGDLCIINLNSNSHITKVINENQNLIPELSKRGFYLINKPEYSTYYLGFNHTQKPFKNNLALRRAISLAFDSVEFNKLFFRNLHEISQSLIPKGMHGFKLDYMNPYCIYDLERAKQLLEESGYPKGKGLPTIIFDTREGGDFVERAEFLKKSLSEIGIRIKIRTNSFPKLLEKLEKRDFMMFDLNCKLDYNDPINILRIIYGGCTPPRGDSFTGFQDERYDELYDKLNVTSDLKERIIIYEEMNSIAGEKIPMIFINHRQHLTLCKPWISYIWTPFNYDLSKYSFINTKKRKKLK